MDVAGEICHLLTAHSSRAAVWRGANGDILQLCLQGLLKIVKIKIIFHKEFICLALWLDNIDMFSNMRGCGGIWGRSCIAHSGPSIIS